MAKRLSDLTSAEKALSQMRYNDLKIACIVRGMAFEEISSGFSNLTAFFLKNFDIKPETEKLTEYDNWICNKINSNPKYSGTGFENFRLGSVISDESGITKVSNKALNKAKIKKEKKVFKKERDKKFNIFKGTKKALTYKCAQEGLTIADTIKKVKVEYPDAVDKSISIWYKKALKAII